MRYIVCVGISMYPLDLLLPPLLEEPEELLPEELLDDPPLELLDVLPPLLVLLLELPPLEEPEELLPEELLEDPPLLELLDELPPLLVLLLEELPDGGSGGHNVSSYPLLSLPVSPLLFLSHANANISADISVRSTTNKNNVFFLFIVTPRDMTCIQ